MSVHGVDLGPRGTRPWTRPDEPAGRPSAVAPWIRALWLALAVSMGSSCSAQSGVALCFDDYFIDQWYGQRALFEQYGARVTFSVTHFDQLETEEVEWLHDLEDDGHEIGCHSLTHADPLAYLETHSVDEYIAEEIEPAIELMEVEGFHPTSFTFPWDGQTDELVDGLLGYFEILRGSGHLEGPQDFYYKPIDGRLIGGARLDEGWWTEDQLDAALRRADRNGSVLVVYAHRILEESDKSHITPDSLETALAMIEERDLPFATLSELVVE